MSVFKSPKRKIFRKKKDVEELIASAKCLHRRWYTDASSRIEYTTQWHEFIAVLQKFLPCLLLAFLLGCSVAPVTKTVPPVPVRKSMASESGITSARSMRILPKFKSFTGSETRKVMFFWNHEHPETVDFYRLYYGAASRSYTNFALALGTNLMFEVKTNAAYYYTVTANTTNGLESDYSNELVFPRHLEPRTNVVIVTMWSTNGTDWVDLKRETNSINGAMGLWKLRVE
jgi:hypothetical protein